jgi:hypothetical protein
MLTYHDKIAAVLIKESVIDLAIDPCLEGKEDMSVMMFSTQVLIHFALNPDSITILLNKGIMSFFCKLDKITD